jgi:hypothetical protein
MCFVAPEMVAYRSADRVQSGGFAQTRNTRMCSCTRRLRPDFNGQFSIF